MKINSKEELEKTEMKLMSLKRNEKMTGLENRREKKMEINKKKLKGLCLG